MQMIEHYLTQRKTLCTSFSWEVKPGGRSRGRPPSRRPRIIYAVCVGHCAQDIYHVNVMKVKFVWGLAATRDRTGSELSASRKGQQASRSCGARPAGLQRPGRKRVSLCDWSGCRTLESAAFVEEETATRMGLDGSADFGV